jgi:hypothetical protein
MRGALVAAVFGLAACGEGVSAGRDEDGGSESATDSGGEGDGACRPVGEPCGAFDCCPQLVCNAGTGRCELPPEDETGTTSSVTDGTTDGDELDSGFLDGWDLDGDGGDCDLWDQDCPDGEKCAAHPSNPGGFFDERTCVPVIGDKQAGESCEAGGDPPGTSGEDDCAPGRLCWGVDPDTAHGYCVPYCEGDVDAPTCDGELLCALLQNELLPLCLPECDPLLGGVECWSLADTCVLAPAGQGFVCVPGGVDPGMYGDGCGGAAQCAPYHFCAPAEHVPGCLVDECCTALCEVGNPAPCPDADDGQECLPVWEDPPPGYEDVGVCAIP